MPVTIPAPVGAPEAMVMPMQRGSATKNTTTEAKTSWRRSAKNRGEGARDRMFIWECPGATLARLSGVSQAKAGNGQEWKGALCAGLYAVAGSRDALASAAGASAWSGELRAIAKDKAAALTGGRFENESSASISCDGLHDVCKVILDLSFRKAKELRKLVGGQAGAG